MNLCNWNNTIFEFLKDQSSAVYFKWLFVYYYQTSVEKIIMWGTSSDADSQPQSHRI